MGLAALAAAQITPGHLILVPSAGTGLLAILPEIAGGDLTLNELSAKVIDTEKHKRRASKASNRMGRMSTGSPPKYFARHGVDQIQMLKIGPFLILTDSL